MGVDDFYDVLELVVVREFDAYVKDEIHSTSCYGRVVPEGRRCDARVVGWIAHC